MKHSFCRRLAIPALAMLTLAGCVSEEKTQHVTFGEPPRASYDQVDASTLVLDLVGTRDFPAGQPALVTFALRNTGKETIEIPEWYARETDNIVVHCQIWGPKQTEPVEDLWIPLAHQLHYPDTRYPLTLAPGQLVTIKRTLHFVSAMAVAPGTERRYFIKASSNLDSLKLESKVSSIRITPGVPRERSGDVAAEVEKEEKAAEALHR